MIRSPLGLRLRPPAPSEPGFREQVAEAAALGARGVVFDAIGELGPDRLSETGRREVRHLLRSANLTPIALHLPTRRPLDAADGLEDRLARIDRAAALAYELGARLVLLQPGAIPPPGPDSGSGSGSEGAFGDGGRRGIFEAAIRQIARRADHRGVSVALETGPDSASTLREFLDRLNEPTLGASVNPSAMLARGLDPVSGLVELGSRVRHAYAGDAARPGLAAPHPRGSGFAPGVLDWEGYLGALEEIAYQGFLTVWPDPDRPAAEQFLAALETARRF